MKKTILALFVTIYSISIFANSTQVTVNGGMPIKAHTNSTNRSAPSYVTNNYYPEPAPNYLRNPQNVSVEQRVASAKFPLAEAIAVAGEAIIAAIWNSQKTIFATLLILLAVIIIRHRKIVFNLQRQQS